MKLKIGNTLQYLTDKAKEFLHSAFSYQYSDIISTYQLYVSEVYYMFWYTCIYNTVFKMVKINIIFSIS